MLFIVSYSTCFPLIFCYKHSPVFTRSSKITFLECPMDTEGTRTAPSCLVSVCSHWLGGDEMSERVELPMAVKAGGGLGSS